MLAIASSIILSGFSITWKRPDTLKNDSNTQQTEKYLKKTKKKRNIKISWEGNVKMIIEMSLLLVGIGVCGRLQLI